MRLRATSMLVTLVVMLLVTRDAVVTRGAGTALAASPPTVVYEMKTVERQDSHCPGRPADCPHITFRYPVVLRAPSPATGEAINRAVGDFLLRSVAEGRRHPSIDAAMDEFTHEYQEYRKLPGARSSYWEERTVTVLYQSNKVFSVSFAFDWYYGGAHPNYSRTFANFNVATGEKVTLADILVAGYQARLDQIGDKKFRESRDLTSGVSLRQAGFRFPGDRFALNDNFSIGAKGITFYYNPYEIAPYAMGPTELILAYREIRDLIRPDGLLGSMRQ